MLITTLSMLDSSAWLWTYLGHEDRTRAILDGMNAEPWDSLAVMHNGQEVRIVAERSPYCPPAGLTVPREDSDPVFGRLHMVRKDD